MANPLNLITPLILTYNEEPNIGRTLEGLSWANRIVAIDSFSTDGTLDLLAANPRVEVVQRTFDTHASQWNAGLNLIDDGWVLSLDADYVVTPALKAEFVSALAFAQDHDINGFSIPFLYCVFGKPLRGTVLPPRIALFRRRCAHYVDDGHTQVLRLSGRCSVMRNSILHDDRKSLDRWIWAQRRYLRLEVNKLLSTSPSLLSLSDRIRSQSMLAPVAIFLLCLLWHRGILDGWRGWFYAFQRMYVEILLYLMLSEERQQIYLRS